MEKLVSIIVPVYNVSKYINECIMSLVGQTFKNIEILLIDDGSKDLSGNICDQWAIKDPRVQVFHKQNGGAASARNFGINVAKGEVVCFVDGDDTVESNYIECLYNAYKRLDVDVVTCGYFYLSISKKDKVLISEKETTQTCDECMLGFLQDWSSSLLWNKMFSRSVIGDIRMSEGHKIDDEFFTYQVCMNCRRVAVIPECLYNYRMRASSVMQDNSPEVAERYMLDRIAYNTERLNNVSLKMPHISEAYFANTIDSMARYWIHSKSMTVAQKQIRRWINGHMLRLLASKLSLKQKISYISIFYFKKPSVVGEQISIVPSDDCFE